MKRAGESAANADSDMFGTATYSGWAAQERYNARAASKCADARECRDRITELESI